MCAVAINVTDVLNVVLQHALVFSYNSLYNSYQLQKLLIAIVHKKLSITIVHLKVNDSNNVLLIVMDAIVLTKVVVP